VDRDGETYPGFTQIRRIQVENGCAARPSPARLGPGSQDQDATGYRRTYRVRQPAKSATAPGALSLDFAGEQLYPTDQAKEADLISSIPKSCFSLRFAADAAAPSLAAALISNQKVLSTFSDILNSSRIVTTAL
jgi:hypothetical protein